MVVAHQSSSVVGAAGTATSITLPIDVSTAPGDLLTITVHSAGPAINTPSGWTPVATGQTYLGMFWRVADGSEGSTVSVTRAAGTSTWVATIQRYTGANVSSPIIQLAALENTAATTSIPLPSITAEANSLLVQTPFASASAAVPFSPPAGTTKHTEDSAPSGGRAAAVGSKFVGAGATGVQTWTSSTSAQVSGLIFAVRGVEAPSAHGNFTILYLNSNTFTVPDGVTSVQFECEGAGGAGGGGGTLAAGGGGGGGAYALKTQAVTPGQTYTITVAPNTTGGASNTAGATGASTSVKLAAANVCLAVGGGGGGAPSGLGGLTPGAAGSGGAAASCVGDIRTSGLNGSGTAGGRGAPPYGNAAGSGGIVWNSRVVGGGGTGGAAITSGAGGAGWQGAIVVRFDYATEAVSASDSYQMVVDWNRDFNETVVANDTIATTFLKPSDDLVSVSDEFTKYIQQNKSDLVSINDVFERYIELTKSDAITLSDDILVVLIYLRYVDDFITALDLDAREVRKEIADSVVALESSFKHILLNPVAMSVVPIDFFSRVVDYQRAPADIATAADSSFKSLDIKFSDSISGTSAPEPSGRKKIYVISD